MQRRPAEIIPRIYTRAGVRKHLDDLGGGAVRGRRVERRPAFCVALHDARNQYGGGVFRSHDGNPDAALSASILTRQGSLHGIDFRFLGENAFDSDIGSCVSAPVIEEVLVDGLSHFLSVARYQLNLETPLTVDVGIEGIKHLRLAFGSLPSPANLGMTILVDRIAWSVLIDSYIADPSLVLLPFFTKVYEEAGHEHPRAPRPKWRTADER